MISLREFFLTSVSATFFISHSAYAMSTDDENAQRANVSPPSMAADSGDENRVATLQPAVAHLKILAASAQESGFTKDDIRRVFSPRQWEEIGKELAYLIKNQTQVTLEALVIQVLNPRLTDAQIAEFQKKLPCTRQLLRIL